MYIYIHYIAVKGRPTTVARTIRVRNVEEVTFGQLKNTSVYIIHNGCRVYTVKIIIYCIVVVVSTETGIDYDDGSLTTAQTHYNVYVPVRVYKIRLNNYK